MKGKMGQYDKYICTTLEKRHLLPGPTPEQRERLTAMGKRLPADVPDTPQPKAVPLEELVLELSDLKFYEHFVLKITKAAKDPTLEFQGITQKFMVVISAETEINEYGERQKTRDERTQALEEMLEKEEKAFR